MFRDGKKNLTNNHQHYCQLKKEKSCNFTHSHTKKSPPKRLWIINFLFQLLLYDDDFGWPHSFVFTLQLHTQREEKNSDLVTCNQLWWWHNTNIILERCSKKPEEKLVLRLYAGRKNKEIQLHASNDRLTFQYNNITIRHLRILTVALWYF